MPSYSPPQEPWSRQLFGGVLNRDLIWDISHNTPMCGPHKEDRLLIVILVESS